MSRIALFVQYANAFEDAYKNDDWSLIEPYFAEDAVYEVGPIPPPLGGINEGRDAILAYFDRVLNGFDRRFATRTISVVDGPREDGDTVWLRGGVTYTAPGVPDLYFELEESTTFRGDRIVRLEDRYDEATMQKIVDYARTHGAKLGLAAG
jgi:ketosteroid isomerase-like protein